jgi:hypothetical protein
MWKAQFVFVVATALTSLAACGGAASEAWVRQPEGGGSIGDEQVALEHDATAPELASESAPQAGPRRLDHTVTLGQIYVSPPGPGAQGPVAAGPPSVTVNVNNYVAPAPGYGYGYGYAGYAAPVVSRSGGVGPSSSSFTTRGGGAATVQPGQSFPAPPSFGPQFPYHLSPASPWETKR